MRSAPDLIALEPQEIVALLIATSFAAGLNVYATVATLGLLSQFDFIVLPEPLAMLESWWVIGACATMFSIEFFADKVPAFDLIWNALHTFVRVPVGALLAYGAAAPLSPGWQLAAAALGGLIAFAAHAGKTAMRAAVTPSPEPLSNIGLSLVEDAVAIFLTWFAVNHPFIAAAIVILMIVMMLVLIRMVIAALSALYRGARRAMGARGSPGLT
jgi:hypothetical protein